MAKPYRNAFLKRFRRMQDERASLLLILLLSTDYIFIILHINNLLDPLEDSHLFRLDIDRSYSEFYQYVKYLWIVILLVYVMVATRCKQYISWILMFIYFLIDDAWQLHERSGQIIGERYTLFAPLELRSRDVGELVVFGVFRVVLISVLAWSYFRGPAAFKKASNDLLLFLGVFVFCVVFLDAFHAAIDFGRIVNAALTLVEDGGEMLVVSLIVWYLFFLALHDGTPEVYLHEGLMQRDVDPSRQGASP